MQSIPNRLFVTGTDTDVGKTVVSATLCAGLKADYWKPVQAGTEPQTDTERVRMWAATGLQTAHPESYCLKLPASPHQAAEEEGAILDPTQIRLPETEPGRTLIVEGAGGLLVPLNRDVLIIDLLQALALPVLLVARSGLGTLNHTLLSLEVLRNRNIEPWGVVLNGVPHPANEDAIRHFGKPARLFRHPPLADFRPESFVRQFQLTFDPHAS